MARHSVRVEVEAHSREAAYQVVATMIGQHNRSHPASSMQVLLGITFDSILQHLAARARRHGCSLEVTPTGKFKLKLDSTAAKRYVGGEVLSTTDLVDVHHFLEGHTWGRQGERSRQIQRRRRNTLANKRMLKRVQLKPCPECRPKRKKKGA